MQRVLRRNLLRGFLAVVVVSSGCEVISEQPVSPLSESAPIPSYLVGTWQALAVAGQEVEPGSGIVVSFDQGPDGSIRIILLGKGDPQEINASLAILGNQHILSLATPPDDPSWLIVNLEHDELTDTLTVQFLGSEAIRHDIELGRVEGEIISSEGHVDSELTASTASLQNYFSTYGQVFNDSILVLERASGEGE